MCDVVKTMCSVSLSPWREPSHILKITRFFATVTREKIRDITRKFLNSKDPQERDRRGAELAIINTK